MIATPALQVNVTAVPVFLSGARQQSSKSCQAEDAKKYRNTKCRWLLSCTLQVRAVTSMRHTSRGSQIFASFKFHTQNEASANMQENKNAF